jgi:hypothetical protein
MKMLKEGPTAVEAEQPKTAPEAPKKSFFRIWFRKSTYNSIPKATDAPLLYPSRRYKSIG